MAHLGRLVHLLSPRHPVGGGGAESCLEVDSCSHLPLPVTSSLLHYAPHVRGILRVVRCHELPLSGRGLCEIGFCAHPLCMKEYSLVNEFLRLLYRHGQQARVSSRVLNVTNLRKGDDGKETRRRSLLSKTVCGDPSHVRRILKVGQVYVDVETDIVHLCGLCACS
jgi:hypothetical protein